MLNWKRIYSVIRKEFIQIRRDPRTVALILLMPIMQLLLFGYAVSNTVDHIPTVIYDQDSGPTSREFVTRLVQSQYFDVVEYVDSMDAIRHQIDGSKAKVGFVIPSDYSTRIARGEAAQVQVLVDGSDPTTAQTILSSAAAVAQSHSTELVTEAMAQRGQPQRSVPMTELRPRVWYNPDMEAVKFNIPGLVGIILQNITLMLTSFAIVRERERGTLEQLIVTPIKPMELMIGKIIPYVVIGFIDLVLALGVGALWFHVPVEGNLLLLLVISMLFLLGALGTGLLISTVSRTQLQAMQLSMFLIMPNILLSGFMFPREAMPKAVYYISNFIPLTYYLTVLRGIILKGVGHSYLWTQVLVLAVFGLGFLALSASRFRKRIE